MINAPSPNAPIMLVGRERERGLLRQRLDAAMAGHGSLVLISGEAGIGKTALAETVCQEACEQGAIVLVGRCYDLTETPPYGPWLELFERHQQTEELPAAPEAFAQRGTAGAVPSQENLFQQVRVFLTGLTTARSVLLLLDDLHWADPVSLDLLRYIARSLAIVPVLALVTYRSDELTRRHPLYSLLPMLVREAGAARLDLRPLDDDAVCALVAARYDLPDAETARLVSDLQHRAEGNALFLDELLRSLEEAGVLRHDGGAWMLSELSDLAVPPLLKQVIEGRLRRLDDESQRLLAVAAVIGHEVPLDLWAAVGEADEDVVLETAERALEAHLLAEGPGGASVRFAHALIREALYESVPAIRRGRIHRQAGEALAAARYPDPDAVASHFERARDARAVPWLIAAGERAEEVYAGLTSTIRFEAALTLMDEDADIAARTRLLLHLAAIHRAWSGAKARPYLDEARSMTGADPLLDAYALLLSGLVHCYDKAGNQGLAEMEEGVARLAALPAHERARMGEVPYGVRQALDEDGVGTLVLRLAMAGRYAEASALGEQVTAATPGRAAGGSADLPRGDA